MGRHHMHRFQVGDAVWIRRAKVGWTRGVVDRCESDQYKGYTVKLEGIRVPYYIGADTDWHIRRDQPTEKQEADMMNEPREYAIGAPVTMKTKATTKDGDAVWEEATIIALNCNNAAYEIRPLGEN